MEGATVANGRGASFGVSSRSFARLARTLFSASTQLFVISMLFDPADRLFGLKLPLYLLCWLTGTLLCLTQSGRVRIPIEMIMYSLVMVTIPLISIWNYYVVDASQPFEGFQLLKAYLFITMALLLYLTKTNILEHLSAGLTLLALSIVLVATAVLIDPTLFFPLYAFGAQYGMFSIDNRDYGGLVLFQMYLVTSPMLVISAAYYFDRYYRSRLRRGRYLLLSALSLIALAIAGTRGNLMAAVLLPLALVLLYARRKWIVMLPIGIAGAIGLVMVADEIGILLSPGEASNRAKLTSLGDYITGFANPLALIFGKGLGAYDHWTGRGHYYITELTYLEIIRNFGLILGGVMLLLLIYPIVYAFALRPSYNEKHVIVAYALYLIMGATNPLMFSSMGMLILAMVIANIAMFNTRSRLGRGMG